MRPMGANVHYATAGLDEGPITEQEAVHVPVSDWSKNLLRTGRAVEVAALSRVVKWHSEQRVLMVGNRTVVFDR